MYRQCYSQEGAYQLDDAYPFVMPDCVEAGASKGVMRAGSRGDVGTLMQIVVAYIVDTRFHARFIGVPRRIVVLPFWSLGQCICKAAEYGQRNAEGVVAAWKCFAGEHSPRGDDDAALCCIDDGMARWVSSRKDENRTELVRCKCRSGEQLSR